VNPMLRGLSTALAIILLPLAALAQQHPAPGAAQPAASTQQPLSAQQQPPWQPAGPSAGIDFELATEYLSPNDSRVSGGSTVFRLGFRTDPASNLSLFYERISETLSFKNGGSTTAAAGESDIDGVGVALAFGATRLEIMAGRGNTIVNTAGGGTTPVNSSDSVVDLGFFWTYHPGGQRALLDLGLVYRQQTLAGAQPGNAIDGGSQTKQLRDLGGLAARLGIGYAF